MFRLYLAAPLVTAVLALSPVVQQIPVDHTAMRRELDIARQRWIRNRPAIYEFTISLPAVRNPWQRLFGTFRVDGDRVTTIASAPGAAGWPAATWTSIDRLFDALSENLHRATHRAAVEYDDQRGFPLNPYFEETAFRLVAFRALANVADRLDPFVVVEHANHCGAMLPERTALGSCPTYSIAMWGDGIVSYIGGSGVATINRREHRVSAQNVAALTDAITISGFFNLADDYSSVVLPGGLVRTIDHSPEKWITISQEGRRKTVHDFYGAPDALIKLEQVIESLADSYRYTKLKRPRQNPRTQNPRTQNPRTQNPRTPEQNPAP